MEGAQNQMQKFKHCEVCNKDIHRSSFAKHLKSKIHNQNVQIISSNFFDELIQKQQARTVPQLKNLARAKINRSNRELAKEIAKLKINPYYFSKGYQPQYEILIDTTTII